MGEGDAVLTVTPRLMAAGTTRVCGDAVKLYVQSGVPIQVETCSQQVDIWGGARERSSFKAIRTVKPWEWVRSPGSV